MIELLQALFFMVGSGIFGVVSYYSIKEAWDGGSDDDFAMGVRVAQLGLLMIIAGLV